MGMVGLSMVHGFEGLAFGLAHEDPFDPATFGATIDDLSTPSMIGMFLMFLPSAFFGVLLSSAALWRSRAVPRGAVILILLFLSSTSSSGRGSPVT